MKSARLRLTFALPVGLAALIGGFIGWTVARVSCQAGACGYPTVVTVTFATSLVAAIGVGIVVVLVDLSLREWRAESGGIASSPEDDDRSPR